MRTFILPTICMLAAFFAAALAYAETVPASYINSGTTPPAEEKADAAPSADAGDTLTVTVTALFPVPGQNCFEVAENDVFCSPN